MTSLTRLRFLNALYSLKQSAKCIDSGMVMPTNAINILYFINEGFSKLEYYYLLKNKSTFSKILNVSLPEEDIEKLKEYACFSNYVILMGFLDSYIYRNMKLHDKLCQADNDYSLTVAQRIARAHSLRKCIMEDYKFELQDSSSPYLHILRHPDDIIPTMSAELTKSQDDNLFNMSGFFQAYLEGYKRNDYTDIEDIIETYQKRKEGYAKYREKCTKDLKDISPLLVKENKPLL